MLVNNINKFKELSPETAFYKFKTITNKTTSKDIIYLNIEETSKRWQELKSAVDLIPANNNESPYRRYFTITDKLNNFSSSSPEKYLSYIADHEANNSSENKQISDLMKEWKSLQEIQKVNLDDKYLTVAQFEDGMNKMKQEQQNFFSQIEKKKEEKPMIDQIVAFFGILSVLSTAFLAWRSDQRESKKLQLEIIEMHTKINEIRKSSNKSR